MRKEKIFCPICAYDDLSAPPYDQHNCPSYEICPCCGNEFGYDDASLSHEDLRIKWISEGMHWWSTTQPAPKQWNPVLQLGFFDKN
ncbi:MAG: hypothetical protein CMO06_01005 [Thalassospira sp.]|nr:hypothetical protein [Thalassospira sp.]